MLANADFEPVQDNLLALTKYLIRQDIIQRLQKVDPAKLPSHIVEPNLIKNVIPPRFTETELLATCTDLKVCVVGAGIAGLYTAMLLDSIGVQWKIIEANPERLGGRILTHYFDKNDDNSAFYDVGAMRYPLVPAMARLNRLVQATNTVTASYHMSSVHNNTPFRYNDFTRFPFEACGDANRQSAINKNKCELQEREIISMKALNTILPDLRRRVINEIIEATRSDNPQNLKDVWSSLLMRDRHSVRQILSDSGKYDERSIDCLDTISFATNLLKHGIIYTVFGSLTDQYAYPSVRTSLQKQDRNENRFTGEDNQHVPELSWYRIVGGGTQLIENIGCKLEKSGNDNPSPSNSQLRPSQRIVKGKRVVKISYDQTRQSRPMNVWYANTNSASVEQEHEAFDAVISSTPLGALQAMDLTELDLPYSTKAAIRSINYSAAAKIAIKFRTAWWAVKIQTRNGKGAAFDFNILGGNASTDMPIRNCVYPSQVSKEGPAVLLCSYTWGQDSQRLASMFNSSSPKVTDQIVQVVLTNLARLHTQIDEEYNDLLDFLTNDFITCHAYDWSTDPFSGGGGFAHYLPGQLEAHYSAIVNPLSDSRFHIIGEAASAHPGWVIGALESAARGVYMMLERFKMKNEQEILANEFGDFVEVDTEFAHVQVALGMLKKHDFIVEVGKNGRGIKETENKSG